MTRLFIVGVLVLMSFAAYPQSQSWMKQNDPDSLGLFVTVSEECPFSQNELQSIAEGEYLRARIQATTSTELNITVDVNCLQSKNRSGELIGYFVHYGIRFGTRKSKAEYVLYESPNYGSMMMGKGGYDAGQFFMNAIRDDVSRAITDYLKANFE